MQGKYITTILKLAVLASSKQQKQIEVKETMAQTSQHHLIWSKELSTINGSTVNTGKQLTLA